MKRATYVRCFVPVTSSYSVAESNCCCSHQGTGRCYSLTSQERSRRDLAVVHVKENMLSLKVVSLQQDISFSTRDVLNISTSLISLPPSPHFCGETTMVVWITWFYREKCLIVPSINHFLLPQLKVLEMMFNCRNRGVGVYDENPTVLAPVCWQV
jgi:hypothetical protein